MAVDTLEDLAAALDENPAGREPVRVRLLTRELLELPQTVARTAVETDRRFSKVDRRLDDHDRRFDRLDANLKRIRDDLGLLKGAHARNVAIEFALEMADELGLRRGRDLSRKELFELTRCPETLKESRDTLKSFRGADLVMAAVDSTGAAWYVAAEVSFTVNGRDVRRAMRNASLLTRWTGWPARAVVAGVHRDERIEEAIESGAVYWYRLNPEHLEAD